MVFPKSQMGGTTDIAVQEITGVNTLKEIHHACGSHWGDITVNEAFYRFLIDAFIPGVDPYSKRNSLVNGLVDNVFDKHTERGQTVKAGEFLKEHEYVPARQEQMAVRFKFYATQNKNPKYVTDEGCSCIGTLYFELSGGMKSNKEMKLKINPSGTQIVAVVTEKDNGHETEGFFCLLD
ncbi:unnamed protein product [Mytilus edulis]|uniref:Uncharacterized protein n=1 Tax=Mytilus edulis TaxID=6550 RepID=A0A8S3UFK8_MYTED|nr:unnamed protein product [Mytilus edulis]